MNHFLTPPLDSKAYKQTTFSNFLDSLNLSAFNDLVIISTSWTSDLQCLSLILHLLTWSLRKWNKKENRCKRKWKDLWTYGFWLQTFISYCLFQRVPSFDWLNWIDILNWVICDTRSHALNKYVVVRRERTWNHGCEWKC